MKKLSALFFLLLFVFNMIGYRFLIQYMQQQEDRKLEISLDKNAYDESQLIELKIALNMPYGQSSKSYQRWDGSVEINGTLYKYVKRKISNDTLYVMCIPDYKKMHLEGVKNNFYKITNDLSQNDNSKKSTDSKAISFKKMQGEFDEHFFYTGSLLAALINTKMHLSFIEGKILLSHYNTPWQPPDAA